MAALFEQFYGCSLETVVGACLGVESDVRAAAKATTSGSRGLGFEAAQHGAELGGRIPVSRHVEARRGRWRRSWRIT